MVAERSTLHLLDVMCTACGTAVDPNWGFTRATYAMHSDQRFIRDLMAPLAFCLIGCSKQNRTVDAIEDESRTAIPGHDVVAATKIDAVG